MNIIIIYHEREGGIEKSVIARDGIFYPTLTRIMNSFYCLPLSTSFIFGKKLEKGFQKIVNTLRCDMVTSFQHYNDVTDRRAASVRLFVFFYLSLGLVRVCEIKRASFLTNYSGPRVGFHCPTTIHHDEYFSRPICDF